MKSSKEKDSPDAGNERTLETKIQYYKSRYPTLLKNEPQATSLSDQDKVELLCFSLHIGDFDLTQILLDEGADVTKFHDGRSPISFALNNLYCPLEIVQLLSQTGIPENGIIEKDTKRTVLHRAVERMDITIIRQMLEKQLDMNVLDTNGLTPLHFATKQGCLKLVQLLVSRGANVNLYLHDVSFTVLYLAISQQNVEMVKLLISLGADVNQVCRRGRESVTPIYLAVGLNNLKIVQLLLDKGADVNFVIPESKVNLLQIAAKMYTKEKRDKVSLRCIVKLLMENGLDPTLQDESNLTPLHWALRRRNYDIAGLMIRSNSRCLNLNFAFHEIMESNDKGLIELSLAYGANLFVKDREGRYPCWVFFTAMVSRNAWNQKSRETRDIIHVVKLLWSAGWSAESTLPKKYMWPKHNIPRFVSVLKQLVTAQNTLYQGIKCNSTKLVRQALEKGATTGFVYKDMESPLHSVAARGNVNSFKLLLAKGRLKVNAVNKQGKTPLHVASEFGHKEMCRLLLENGAVYNLITEESRDTPLELAKKNGHADVEELLKSISFVFQTLLVKRKLAKLDPFKAVVNCRNRQGKTLMEAALGKDLMPLAEEIMKKKLVGEE